MATPTVRDLGASLVRTFVATGVGTALAYFGRKTGVVLDGETSAGAIQAGTAMTIGIYYLLVRSLEIKIPGFGWLLGLAKLPAYPAPTNEVPLAADGSVPTK